MEVLEDQKEDDSRSELELKRTEEEIEEEFPVIGLANNVRT